jgi:microcystin-dependent protein
VRRVRGICWALLALLLIVGAVSAGRGEMRPAAQGVPSGAVLMWSGSIKDVPEGYALCDGTQGTPDLRGRFIAGAGEGYVVGDRGGAESNDLGHRHQVRTETGWAGAHGHHMMVSAARGTSNTTPERSGIGGPPSVIRSVGPITPTQGHRHEIVGLTEQALGRVDNRPPYFTLAFIMRK